MADDSGHDHEAKDLSPTEEPSSQAADAQDAEHSVPVPEELLAEVPREQRQAISRAVRSVTQFSAPVFNPIFQKITSEHISQIIGNIENDSVREHNAGNARRRYRLIYFVLGACITVGLVVFFIVSDNGEFVPAIITGITGFLGGLAAGPYLRD